MGWVRYIANSITAGRILGSLCMLLTPACSPGFYLCYSLCGLSDMIDGSIARATHTAGRTGAALDSIADLFFFLITLFKLLPVLIAKLPVSVLWLIALAAVIRIGAYVAGGIRFRRFAALHTIANKVTGAALFGIVYLIPFPHLDFVWLLLCILAGISATEELLINLFSSQWNPDVKWILEMR